MCKHTHRVSSACPTEGVRFMSQQRYTHRLYSYRTDATYSVNTRSPPPPLRSLAPSIHPSLFLPPPALSSNCLSLTICILLLLPVTHTHTHRCSHTHQRSNVLSTHAAINSTFAHTHHFLFIVRWVDTGCPQQPSLYIVMERGGLRQEGPVDSSQRLASPSTLYLLYWFIFMFLNPVFPLVCVSANNVTTVASTRLVKPGIYRPHRDKSWPDDGAGWKVSGSPKWLQFILMGTWMSVANFTAIDAKVIEIVHWK